ncbi:MAG: TOBE domain-containing protein, partial [Pseudomonadota bacterium]|nr:TOBE domain-containing protein [Pseudomonadota bacterium]
TVRGAAIMLGDGTAIRCGSPLPAPGTAVKCSVRPERIMLRKTNAEAARAADNILRGVVDRCIFAGSSSTYLLTWHGQTLKVLAQNSGSGPFPEGSEVALCWPASSTVMLRSSV